MSWPGARRAASGSCQLDIDRDRAENQVWAAYANLKTALAQQRAAQALLAAANTSYQVAIESYNADVRNTLDVVQAQRLLPQARSQDVTARANVFRQAAGLAFSTGDLPRQAPARLPGVQQPGGSSIRLYPRLRLRRRSAPMRLAVRVERECKLVRARLRAIARAVSRSIGGPISRFRGSFNGAFTGPFTGPFTSSFHRSLTVQCPSPTMARVGCLEASGADEGWWVHRLQLSCRGQQAATAHPHTASSAPSFRSGSFVFSPGCC